VTTATAADLAQHYRLPGGGLLAALVLARLLPLLLCWRYPTAAVLGSVLAGCLTAPLITPVSPAEPWPWPVSGVLGYAVVLVTLGSSGAGDRTRRWFLAGAWVAGVAPAFVGLALFPGRGAVADLVPAAAVWGVTGAIAELVAARRTALTGLAEQREISAAARQRQGELRERARIARELHDVVAHHLSVVVVRADSAAVRLPGLAPAAQTEFAEIAGEARASLEEMRQVLRLLRDGPAPAGAAVPAPPRAPQPGLAELAPLVNGARRAGAEVDLTLPELAPGLDATVGLTAYRVVQEALTNAMRHAPGTPIQVSVRAEDGLLRIEVRNGRSAEPAPDRGSGGATGPGHGLAGIRERVAQLDGTVTAAPTVDGGFAVVATLPGGRS
jgi:signal transduction histidine kinase